MEQSVSGLSSEEDQMILNNKLIIEVQSGQWLISRGEHVWANLQGVYEVLDQEEAADLLQGLVDVG